MGLIYYPDNEVIKKTFDDIRDIAFNDNVKVGTRLDALKFVFEHYSIRESPNGDVSNKYFDRQLKEFEDKRSNLVKEIEELENAKKVALEDLEDEKDDLGGSFWSRFCERLLGSQRGKS